MVEPRLVMPVVGGSSPLDHPSLFVKKLNKQFLCFLAARSQKCDFDFAHKIGSHPRPF